MRAGRSSRVYIYGRPGTLLFAFRKDDVGGWTVQDMILMCTTTMFNRVLVLNISKQVLNISKQVP